MLDAKRWPGTLGVILRHNSSFTFPGPAQPNQVGCTWLPWATGHGLTWTAGCYFSLGTEHFWAFFARRHLFHHGSHHLSCPLDSQCAFRTTWIRPRIIMLMSSSTTHLTPKLMSLQCNGKEFIFRHRGIFVMCTRKNQCQMALEVQCAFRTTWICPRAIMLISSSTTLHTWLLNSVITVLCIGRS